MEQREKIFPKGVSVFKNENEKTPWIKGKLYLNKQGSAKLFEDYAEFVNAKDDLTFNICYSESKQRLYIELDTWKPTPKPEGSNQGYEAWKQTGQQLNNDVNVEDIPF